MGVAGELQAEAGLFDDGQPRGRVVEQDAGARGVKLQGVERGFHAQGRGSCDRERRRFAGRRRSPVRWRERGCRRGDGFDVLRRSLNSSWLPVEK